MAAQPASGERRQARAGLGARSATGARLLALLRREWLAAAVAAMALAGIAISIYLTTEHYAKAEPFCPTVGPINCASVLRSKYSVVPLTGSASPGIPLTRPGGIWFLVSGGLAAALLFLAYRQRAEPEWLRPALLLWSAAGLLFVLYLVFAEIVLIRNICLWCTGVHLLTLLTFLAALTLWQRSPALAEPAIVAPPARTRQSPGHGAARATATSRATGAARPGVRAPPSARSGRR